MSATPRWRTELAETVREAGPPEPPSASGNGHRPCKVCAAAGMAELGNGREVRNVVTALAAELCTVASIHRQIGPMMRDWPAEDRISYDSLRRHLANHLPWRAALMRRQVAEQARQALLEAEGAALRIGTEVDRVHAVADLVIAQVASGRIPIETSAEALSWVRYSQTLRRELGEGDGRAARTAYSIVINTFLSHATPEVLDKVAQALGERRQAYLESLRPAARPIEELVAEEQDEG